MSDRIAELKKAVMEQRPGICTERALIWTKYYRRRANRKKPAPIAIAEALSCVLAEKTVRIYPRELIVGNYTSKRVGGSIFPELHGIPVLLDLFTFTRRETNPLEISPKERRKLIGIIPFWLFRFLGFRAFRSPIAKARFILDQLVARWYLINESGGISHFAPDYETLLAIGTDGYRQKASGLQAGTEPGSGEWNFYEGIKIICEGLARFGERYAACAEEMASTVEDDARRQELMDIARVCRRVPRFRARTLREAVQSLFFAQIALNIESLDNSVCPGRMDSYLYPYYIEDLRSGKLDREAAKEVLSCLSVKMSEIIPVFSRHLTNFHGGMFNGQVVTVGGTDEAGNDTTNELSYIFLEIMDELRMRQPNYHARMHRASPAQYLGSITAMLAAGSNSPALYGDEAIVAAMVRHGYEPTDARDYTGVGCVEPVSQGRSFSSTDAAIFNVPGVLELALNGGRRFGKIASSGAHTMSPKLMSSMDDVLSAFDTQLRAVMERLIRDLRAVERANRLYHPTPLTSMLIRGCLESGRCSTAGGARYNFSGVQCVAPADTGDALRAIEKAVFQDKRYTLAELVSILKKNIPDEKDRVYLECIVKFGNDDDEADRWTRYVAETFEKTLSSQGKNTRGGDYVMGLYSVTAHEYFGRITGALPHGRRKGESFASGISPQNGKDLRGPTALLNSVNRLETTRVGNGLNFNLKFDPHTLRGPEGTGALQALIRTYFSRGGMQAQINVLDPSVLIEARNDPSRYPNLLVRVSGYSAYFNDLSPAMKDEIIRRSTLETGESA
ncbi:MAG: formate acetyltransferase [Spirochaetes bacterium]|nr:formate acetyltransferase [Spirochaetota bacterium]